MFHIYSQILRALTKSAVNHAQEWERERVSTKPKVKIEDGEVGSCSGNIVDLVVPDGITGIWAGALGDETRETLKTVVIAEGVEYIRSNTFQNCKKLISVKLPESVRYIQTKAFANCVNLREINFPEGIREISPDAFDNCPHIRLPDLKAEPKPKVQSSHSEEKPPENTAFSQQLTEKKLTIENNVLVRCTGAIKILIVPEGVTEILYNALSSETRQTVEKIVILGKTRINAGAFADCPKLVSVSLPENKGIGMIFSRSFANCVSLREINIPNTVSCIEEDAFYNCPKLTISEEVMEQVRYREIYDECMSKYYK